MYTPKNSNQFGNQFGNQLSKHERRLIIFTMVRDDLFNF